MSFRYPAFVINLDRHPGRLAAFRERNAPTGIDIVRFAAVEGAKLGPIERTVISKTGRLTSGAIGCAASHRALWQLCVTLGRPIVVFEDDAALRHDLATALPHAVASIGGLKVSMSKRGSRCWRRVHLVVYSRPKNKTLRARFTAPGARATLPP